MDLSIIIVNYKSSSLIVNCLETVYGETTKILLEVIVVDNDSKDNSKVIILERFSKVQWIDMNYNAGFARANNAGIRNSKGKVILLLNPDTLIGNNAIEKCYYEFISADFVACGVQLLNLDRSPQISGNYVMKGGLNYLLPLPYLGAFFKWIASLFKIKKPNVPNAKGIVEVDWINGAFLMVKKNAIEISGLLDEDFFLYAEEAEWCGRLRKAGRLCIFGDINIIHLQGETANEIFESKGKGYKNLFDKKGLQIMLSNLVRIRKQFGIIWFTIIFFIYIVEIPVFFLGYILSGLMYKKKYMFKDVKHFALNVFYILNLTPKIISNKPYFYKT